MSSRELGSDAAVGRQTDTDRAARATRRYLDLLRDALLDEHYLDNELRIEHLLDCLATRSELDPRKLGNPARHMAPELRRRRQQRHAGELPADPTSSTGRAEVLAYASLGRVRLDHLAGCLETIHEEAVDGDLVEVGTGRGGAAIFMRGFLAAQELSRPHVWVVDRFDGRAPPGSAGSSRFPPDLDTVRDGFARFGLFDDRITFLQGPPSRMLAEAAIGDVALLRVGAHDPEDVRMALETVHDRLVPGGFVVVDGYGAAGCQETVDRFREEHGLLDPLQRIDWTGVAWRRSVVAGRRESRPSASSAGVAAQVASAPVGAKGLAVVVVVHNMRRLDSYGSL